MVSGFLAVALAIVAAPALAQTPEGVSPGAVDRIVEVEGRCPSFYWSGVPGAMAYELVVYRLPEKSAASDAATIELSRSDEVLYARLPGGATAWQPELDQSLEPGATYVWFVRAIANADTGEVSEWSAGRYFEVAAAPSAREVERALQVLGRWQAANGDGALTPSSAAAPAVAAAPAAAAAAVADSGAGAGASGPKSVPTATAAIRGSSPDTTGETYGVVGISASPDGAGVAAANTAGGPDLVLDGSLDGVSDAHLSEQGIDRPSGSAQTFSFSNTGGGGMVLDVEGVEVTTTDSDLDADKLLSGTVPDGRLTGSYSQTLNLSNPANEFTGGGAGLTGVDADTLDGIDGAAYATDAYTLALMSLHRGSADHDGRYYTETELNTSGAGGHVHWNNLTAVPAGFADGVDNDTTYSVGPGLIVDNGQILIDPDAFSTRLTYVDGVGSVGDYNSVAIGADGFGLISYFDATGRHLKVAHCNDVICSEATLTTLDTANDVGKDSSIAIGTDGLGLISYFDESNGYLKVAHCTDVPCSSATISILDSGGYVGSYTSIAIGADGRGLVSYYNSDAMNLKVAHCNDVACTSATTPTLDSTGNVGQYTSIAIGADGLALISYYDVTNGYLKIAHCNDASCTSATNQILDNAGNTGRWSSIAIGADGLGLVSYHNGSANLAVAHCDNVVCSSASITKFGVITDVDGRSTSIAIGSDGLGLISSFNFSVYEFMITHCRNPECSSSDTASLGVGGGVSSRSSVAIGIDGLGLIACYDADRGDLAVVHLGIGVP
jgi:hypothetical protein